ncbi:MAG: alpha/beta fold hydrolase [Candidatus Eremiobacterota bacterium]
MTAPALQRPMLFVHGYLGWADQGRPLADYFAGNPANRVGATFRSGHEDEFRQSVRENPPGTVYSIALSDSRASYTEVAHELSEAVEILNRETGQEVDVVAHSMGGLVTREHLDGDQDGIHDVFFLGTPNRGVPGTIGAKLLSSVLGSAPEALLADRTPITSGHNPHLAGLNRRWPGQRAKLHQAYTVAGTRLPTASSEFPFLSPGDGVVAARSVDLEGAHNLRVRDLDPFSLPLEDNHLSLLTNPKVLAFIGEAVTDSGTFPP